jgi:hypothetical protein
VSISDRKCISLLPGAVTFSATFGRDGKSFLYTVASRGEVTIFRQPWKDGKTIRQIAWNTTSANWRCPPILYSPVDMVLDLR